VTNFRIAKIPYSDLKSHTRPSGLEGTVASTVDRPIHEFLSSYLFNYNSQPIVENPLDPAFARI
jgi:hypothetical protein